MHKVDLPTLNAVELSTVVGGISSKEMLKMIPQDKVQQARQELWKQEKARQDKSKQEYLKEGNKPENKKYLGGLRVG
jgi:hypothetical protein